jgi:quercetin dioxygenase-like cupin family protein
MRTRGAPSVADNIEKLRELTNKLPTAPSMVMLGAVGSTALYGLYKENRVAVLRGIVPEGDTYPRHEHPVTEHLILVSGHAIVEVNGGEKVELFPGDHCGLRPHVPHSFTAVEDTMIIAVTVPAEEGYPDAGSS